MHTCIVTGTKLQAQQVTVQHRAMHKGCRLYARRVVRRHLFRRKYKCLQSTYTYIFSCYTNNVSCCTYNVSSYGYNVSCYTDTCSCRGLGKIAIL